MILKKLTAVFFICINFSPFTTGQNSTQQLPCSFSEASQFDFWIGEWEVKWENSDGTKGEGTNTVSQILGGCVILEEFNGNPGSNLIGKSFTVFNPSIKKWQQTWVDNYGSYLDFIGEYRDNKMILNRVYTDSNKNKIKQRMIFYNIKKDSFDWNWEKSSNDEETWELSWEIHYSRLK